METQLDSPAPSSPEESSIKPITVVEKPETEIKKSTTPTTEVPTETAETRKQSIGNMFGGKMFSLPQVVAAAKKEQAQPTNQQQQQQKSQQETVTTTTTTTGGFFSFFKRTEAKKPEVKSKSPVQVHLSADQTAP